MFQETKSRLKQATGCLSPPLLQVLMPHISELENKVQEIRLRVNRPVTVIGTGGSRYFTLGGTLTDLPCGDWDQMWDSLGKIAALEGDLFVYPGHGDATTLDRERAENPYLSRI